MTRTETITMSMRELDRLKVIEAVAEARLMTWRAAERLGLSRRQVERLVIRYRDEGAAGLVSQRRGARSNHQLPQTVLDRALGLIRDRYADFGPTLACEKLRECHGLMLSKETVRHLMTDAGLWVPRKQRPPRIYQPRARRACFGGVGRSTAASMRGSRTARRNARCWCISPMRRAA
jgi:transposase